VRKETPLGLYKGLGAVLTGIVPKMAIRFTSYEWYKQLLANPDGTVSAQSTFLGKWDIELKRSTAKDSHISMKNAPELRANISSNRETRTCSS